MPRRGSRRRRGGRRGRRKPAGSIVPIYPGLYGPGHAVGILARWFAQQSRFGISRALIALIGVTVAIWILVVLSRV